MDDVLSKLEVLVAKFLGKPNLKIFGRTANGIGTMGITGLSFSDVCYFTSYETSDGMEITIHYKNYCPSQKLIKNSEEYTKFVQLILRVEDYILKQDELEFLSFLAE